MICQQCFSRAGVAHHRNGLTELCIITSRVRSNRFGTQSQRDTTQPRMCLQQCDGERLPAAGPQSLPNLQVILTSGQLNGLLMG